MLRVIEPVPALNAAERFALSTLLDLSRVVIADADAAVELLVVGTGNSTGLDASGRIRLRAADPRVTLEDASGRALPSVAA